MELSLSSSVNTPASLTTIVPGYFPTSVTNSNSTPAQSGPSWRISLSAIVLFVGSALGAAYAALGQGKTHTPHRITAMANMRFFFL